MAWNKLILAVAALSPLTACGSIFGESYTYRYRMTVEVDTPQGLRSGSSVIENTETAGSGIPDTSIHLQTRGQAVVVELPDNRVLLAVLRTPDGFGGSFAQGAYEKMLPSPYGEKAWAERDKVLLKQRYASELPLSNYPMIITFRDIDDPTTVEAVTPAKSSQILGDGVRIRRIVIQITNDPITTGIKSRLPWLEHLGMLVPRSGQRIWPNNPEKNLGQSAFFEGI